MSLGFDGGSSAHKQRGLCYQRGGEFTAVPSSWMLLQKH